LRRRISALVSAKPALVGAFTLIQSGLRWRGKGLSGVISFMTAQIAMCEPACHPQFLLQKGRHDRLHRPA
jgi:hypothetical protein